MKRRGKKNNYHWLKCEIIRNLMQFMPLDHTDSVFSEDAVARFIVAWLLEKMLPHLRMRCFTKLKMMDFSAKCWFWLFNPVVIANLNILDNISIIQCSTYVIPCRNCTINIWNLCWSFTTSFIRRNSNNHTLRQLCTVRIAQWAYVFALRVNYTAYSN